MSFFASQTQSDPIPIPFDLPHTIVVRQLTGEEYRASINESEGRIVALFRKALAAGGVKDQAVFAAAADPLYGHDRLKLVVGLVSCSRPLPMRKTDPPVAMTLAEAVKDMGDEALDFVATEVLRLTKPAFFVKVEAVEDANTQSTAVAPAA